jgi:hypothetical protein
MAAVAAGGPTATVEVCESCHGVWFDWFVGEASALARYLQPRAGRAACRPAICPRDGAELIEQPYLDSGPLVHRCPTCLGLFVRPDRLRALQDFHTAMPDRPPEPIERASLLARFWHTFAG